MGKNKLRYFTLISVGFRIQLFCVIQNGIYNFLRVSQTKIQILIHYFLKHKLIQHFGK